jgi:hypothetical protein
MTKPTGAINSGFSFSAVRIQAKAKKIYSKVPSES